MPTLVQFIYTCSSDNILINTRLKSSQHYMKKIHLLTNIEKSIEQTFLVKDPIDI